MDVEETKKIIQSKIEAQAAIKNVRSKIKSYIHEKQNLREGFKETFKPFISSQDKINENIANQQNAMIEQLQKNQLDLTEGLDKNRLAITQGFDKMDEVKKWDLQQLPGYEAIEEPEKRKKDLLGDDDDDDDDDDDESVEEYEDEEVTLRVPKEEESKVVTFTDADLGEGLLNAAFEQIMKKMN